MEDSSAIETPQGLRVRFHWLAFTCHAAERRKDVLDLLACCLLGFMGDGRDDLFLETTGSMNGYQKQLLGPHGCRVLYSPDRPDVHVIMPGEACEASSTVDLLKLFFCQETLQLKFRRMDIALDGVRKGRRNLDPAWVYRLLKNNPEAAKCGAKLGGDESLEFRENRLGATCYIGSKNSERRLCIYNKRGFTRMELRLTGERAEATAQVFEKRVREDLPRVIVGLIRDFIEFRKVGRCRQRARLAKWWLDNVGSVEAISVDISRVEPHLEKTFQYLCEQYGPTFDTMLRWAGGNVDIFLKLAAEGHGRVNARHKRLLREAGGVGSWGNDEAGELCEVETISDEMAPF